MKSVVGVILLFSSVGCLALPEYKGIPSEWSETAIGSKDLTDYDKFSGWGKLTHANGLVLEGIRKNDELVKPIKETLVYDENSSPYMAELPRSRVSCKPKNIKFPDNFYCATATVLVGLDLNDNCEVEKIILKESSSFEVFNKTALEAASNCKFTGCKQKYKAVIPYVFKNDRDAFGRKCRNETK